MAQKKTKPSPQAAEKEVSLTVNEATAAVGGSDIETLRDILYGNQARATDDRLSSIERRLETTRHDFNDALNDRITKLGDSAAADLAAVRDDLGERLDQQSKEQTTRLDAVESELTASLEKMAADFREQLKKNQADLSAQLDKMNADLSDRLLALQEDSRQRDSDLRQELLTLSAWLDDKKASRRDLGAMLADIGQQLQQEGKPTDGKLEND